MLPSLLAQDLQSAVHQFLRSAFPISTAYFQASEDGAVNNPQALIERLIAQPGLLFKGPYLDIKLPFRQAPGAQAPLVRMTLPFPPYAHQMRAFKRLAGAQPQSTLVATGTGSGKTECFMYPVLDHCLLRREQGVRGIKAVVIYPMNALAADQARRFAKEVAQLSPQLSVGLFVGSDQKNASGHMGPEHVISRHDTLRRNPPDILLTNYKMLDFLLIRPKDRPLWQHNKPGVLRYLVVDELHTFDGAQGTDLACLIRRLRDRLDAGSELTCVGTSATLGTGSEAELIRYAQDVFAARFDHAAVITEDRLRPDQYLASLPSTTKGTAFLWPNPTDQRLDPASEQTANDYVNAQIALWFDADNLPHLSDLATTEGRQAAVQLGQLLGQHPAFHELIQDTHAAGQPGPADTARLAQLWQQKLNLEHADQAQKLLLSLTTLVSAARNWRDAKAAANHGKVRPFLEVREQLWLRELRRMVCSVPQQPNDLPRLHFADDLPDSQTLRDDAGLQHLPLLHCRQCHMAAWGAVQKDGDKDQVQTDLQGFYQSWFGKSIRALLLVPEPSGTPSEKGRAVQAFCPACQRLQAPSPDGCRHCGHEFLHTVWLPDMTREVQRDGHSRLEGHRDCPSCGARESLAVVGYQAITLASTMAGRLFSSRWNDDYKLIAFSDSVQDAAHRAGFMGASTWRNVVRQAMSIWLSRQHGPVSLRDMKAGLPQWWRSQMGNDARFCGLFIAPDKQWLRDFVALTETNKLPPGSDLAELVGQRLGWESLLEFGSRSAIGRSLERMGVAAVGMDVPRLQQDVKALGARLREEIQSLRDTNDTALLQFVLGWLHHLRQAGAIHDAVLDSYLANKGREFLLNDPDRRHSRWLPGYGGANRPPVAVTLRHLATNFEALTLASRRTWSTDWLKKTLGQQDVFVAAEARQVFALMLSLLARNGWLVERDCTGQSVYMLDPEQLRVHADAALAVCNQCRHPLPVAAPMATLYDGMPCLRSHCVGHLQLVPGQTLLDWRAAQPHRLVPHEHTGLLSAEKRAQVEQSFIAGQEPWDINVLSATPTLEMGIDIGNLSSVFLCSVPPTQANYLQRIGRAGRRDGNALAITVANGRNHDLYFNADPLEMMAGQVHTPGVFLRATAVLERQLIAYCLDRWVATGIDDGAIPGKLDKVLGAVQHKQRDRFPYTFCAFVHQNSSSLLQRFFALFDALDDGARTHLSDFLQGNELDQTSLAWRLLNRLEDMVRQRQAYKKQIDRLKTEQDRLRQLPQDEATKETLRAVTAERNALMALRAKTNEQPMLNFFTDEGLLPNYAFPEAGVTLQSVILRRVSADGADDASSYAKLGHSFQRPAQAALSELAPENRFYAVSHKLPIDKIDLISSTHELWRFCDRCQYTERVDIGDVHSACPRCGSAQWADSGQKHTVLKLRQVYSTVRDRDSRISDDSEQREPVFYSRQMLLDAAPDAGAGGYRLSDDTLPFGFEFLRRVTLREVNFGARGEQTNAFRVAGQDLDRPGFRICRHCGKVQKKRPRRGERLHDFTCPIGKDPAQDGPEHYFDSLYLYRELESEAIRILLPLNEVAYSDEKLHSLIAALNLGLKHYFHGDVHHLQVTDVRRPDSSGTAEQVFLVIYDCIPGGTGYLKELMSEPGKMLQVLQAAAHCLQHCSCAWDEHKDGCYRCIYAYRDSRNMKTISRRAALQVLQAITSRWDTLEPTATLGNISTNALTESALEQRFLDALRSLAGARLTATLVHGKAGYTLTLPGADGRPVAWEIEQQVRMGPTDGVALGTDIDFVLWPAREQHKRQCRPIAVYTDGLQYHRDIVADDVAKRSALLLSRRFYVWTLTWDDLPDPQHPEPLPAASLMQAAGSNNANIDGIFNAIAAADWGTAAQQRARAAWGSFAWLEKLLRAPALSTTACVAQAVYRALTVLAPQASSDAALRGALQQEVAAYSPSALPQHLGFADESRLLGGFLTALGNALPGLKLAVSLPPQALQPAHTKALVQDLRLLLYLQDDEQTDADAFKSAWRNFWHGASLLQFAPGFAMSTQRAIATDTLNQLWTTGGGTGAAPEPVAPQAGGLSSGWQDALELSTLSPDLLEALAALELPAPEVGMDLTDANGIIVLGGDVVELAWPAQQVAVVNTPNAPALAGWQLLPAASSELKTRLQQWLRPVEVS